MLLIIGTGFSGSVVARQLADAGCHVTVIDKRPHIAGNAFDHVDEHGVLIHQYGPHIFHTNSQRIFEYLSQYTRWRPYEHRVLAKVADKLLPIPINQTTINQLYDLELDDEGVQAFLENVRIPIQPLKTSEDVVLNSVGDDLCNKFFRGYTQKQWGLDLSALSAGVAARIPTRTNTDDRYFTDTYQFMPEEGYTKLFENLLNHQNISISLSTDFKTLVDVEKQYDHIVYTGPIDEYFDYCFGKLPYRSLRFEHQHFHNIEQFQPVGTVNYPNDFDYTRITEFKHLTGQKCVGTSTVKEFPTAEGEPYYPIPRPENEVLFKKYKALADSAENVTFVGRLAQYRYYNMDQVVGAALKAAEDILEKFR